MAEVLNESLLEPSNTISRSRMTRPALVAAVAGLVLTAGFAGYTIGQVSSTEPEMPSDIVMAKIAQMQNATDLAVAAYSPSCYSFTGSTCLTQACPRASEGTNAQCSDGKCSCLGSCSGADGNCYSKTNTKIAGKISLTNGKWTGSWLYMQQLSLLSQLKVSGMPSWSFGGNQYFDLYELPGVVNGKKQYFLSSNKWTNWVAAIRMTGSILSASVSPFGLFGLNLVHTIAPWDVHGITLQVCSMAHMGMPNSVMIGSSGAARTEWAYVHHGSWFVYGWGLSSDPGEGGYWRMQDANGRDVQLAGLDPC